ncbi:MAG: hypothetical protein A3F11_03165 [Gammaproteobacteria bacterium RIFCSPHIGHO2_12_FULL_37_14]|nr:MAG: hypothetical protein A3F11_03165 [Gammaproteobacteria bacterium RIFCSPHIGHO2_12_FULL_37_14]
MKVLCLTPWFPSHRQDQNGNFIFASVEALADLGHEVTVLVTTPWRPKAAGVLSKDWVKKKIHVEQFSEKLNLHACSYLSIPRSYFYSFTHWQYRKFVNPLLEKLIRRHGCQLIHAHTELAGVSAVDVGQKLGVPSVLTLHGISTEPKLYVGNTRKILFEYAMAKTSRVVLVGNPLLNFAKQFVSNSDHFRIVSNGFRTCAHNAVNNKKHWPTKQLRFISVSNLQESKGIDINLRALAKLNSMGIVDWEYKIIGDGREKNRLGLLIKELNLSQQVDFLGACDQDEVYKQLTKADVFILPSYLEAFGIAYLEAMSCGLLTVGIEGQGSQAFIEHGKTGFLAQPKNIDSLVDILRVIFQYPEKSGFIAESGKNHVHQNFTWHSHATNLIKIYEELV